VSLAAAKAIGEDIEQRAIERVDGLTEVPGDDWHDAIADAVIDPTAAPALSLGSTLLVCRGTPIEIKAARMRVSAGSRERDGYWYFTVGQHGQLLGAAGAYLLTVYADGARPEVRQMLLVPATIIDEVLAGRWYDVDRDEERVAQLRWSILLEDGDCDD